MALRRCLSAEYLDRIDFRKILAFAARVERSCGRVQDSLLRSQRSDTQAVFEYITALGYAVPVQITIDKSNEHRISNALLWPPWHFFRSRSEVKNAVLRLGMKAALYAAEISDDGLTPWLDVNGSDVLSVASMMKLYVLASVAEDVASGRRAWTDDVELHDADRSCSSGVMHTWPSHTRLSLQAAAALMIGESDNTASDMLLHALGRRRLEATLAALGNSAPERNTPFLSTAEMWKLKYDNLGRLGKTFLELSVPKRGEYLEQAVADVSVGDVLTADPLVPSLVDKIGWFASARDLAVALRHLWQISGGEEKRGPLAILGTKSMVAFPEWCADYLGAKDGHEPGIRSVGYIAKIDGRWHVVVCVVNDALGVAEEEFWAVARGVLAAANRKLD